MLSNIGHDDGRTIDWGKTSQDYASYRPGPPPSFYEKLGAFGIGRPGQRILDLGTGTGVVARQMARQGCRVAGLDISEGQIEVARALATKENLSVDFQVAPAEKLPYSESQFDVVTANQCWLYFDKPKVLQELKRVLSDDGLFVLSHFSWLPRIDPIARASEKLILKYNPAWSANGWNGVIPTEHDWMKGTAVLRSMFFYDVEIEFSRESWRGRMRACRGIGAALTNEEIKAFDKEHDELLKKIAGDTFTITHRIDSSVFSLNGFDKKHTSF